MSTLTRAGAVEHGLRGWPRGRPWGALKVILRGPWEFSGTSLRAPGGLLGILGVPLAGLVTSEGLWVWVIGDPESPWVARGGASQNHREGHVDDHLCRCREKGSPRAPRRRPLLLLANGCSEINGFEKGKAGTGGGQKLDFAYSYKGSADSTTYIQ